MYFPAYLLGFDLQIDINLLPIVELADRFGVTPALVELCVHLIINGWLERGEAKRSFT
jgi:hypothetical protein